MPFDRQTPFSLSGLDHLLLLSKDLEADVRFYTDVVGCHVRARMPQHAMIELDAGAGTIALVGFTTPEGAWAAPTHPEGRNLDHFALSLATGDEEHVRDHLARFGVDIEEERVEDGRVSLYIRDPSGNAVELMLPRPLS